MTHPMNTFCKPLALKPSPTHTVWQDTDYNMFLLIIIIDDFATLVFVQGSESLVTSYKFVSLLLPSPLAITQCQGNKTEHSSCHILCLDLTLSSPLIGQ